MVDSVNQTVIESAQHGHVSAESHNAADGTSVNGQGDGVPGDDNDAPDVVRSDSTRRSDNNSPLEGFNSSSALSTLVPHTQQFHDHISALLVQASEHLRARVTG